MASAGRSRPPLAFWALAAGAGTAALVHALWVGAACDDAGIGLAYARNLASGEGLRLTPLSPRVEAFSNPLWVLWLAAGFAARLARGDGALFARLSGAAAAAAAAVLVGLVPSRAEGRAPRPVDALAPWLLALDTTYAAWAGSGMESGAFALALAAALVLLAAEQHSGRGLASAVPVGMLAVLRPEGPLYAAAILASRAPRILGARAERGRRVREELSWIAVAAAPAAAWLAFRLAYYGGWLPNSYVAKSTWDFGGTRYLEAWFAASPWVHAGLLAAPLALLARVARRAALLALPPVASAAAFVLWAGGDWMREHRFVAHALPAAMLLVALAPPAAAELLGRAWRVATRRGPVRLVRAVAFGLAALLWLAAAANARARSPAVRARPPFPLAYVAGQARWYRSQADRLGLSRPRIAHFDIGAFSLAAGAEIVDLAGLADVTLARTGSRRPEAAREYVFGEVRPEFLNIHDSCAYLAADPRLRRDYALLPGGGGGENYVRRSILAGDDDGCPGGLAALRALDAAGPDAISAALGRAAAADPPSARALWLCARAHLAASRLPARQAEALGERLAEEGLREPDPVRARALLAAAIALRPQSARAARRLDDLRPP